MENFKGKRISVIGAARSGMDAARILSRLGAFVLLSDSQTREQIGSERLALLHDLDVNFVLGANGDMALPPNTELVVTSPGVPKNAPVLQAAVQRGIPVWSEIELAYRLTDAPILAITGTNGKTTTTLLLAHILQTAGQNAVVAGNISADDIKRTLVSAAGEWEEEKKRRREEEKTGDRRQETGEGKEEASSSFLLPPSSLSPCLLVSPSSPACIVAEISSFQLEWVEKFAPRVAILTNITPDHLNRHSGFEEYAQTKARLFAAQTTDDRAILNYDNSASRQIGESGLPGRRAWFTRQSAPPDTSDCAWVQDGFLTLRMGGGCPIALIRETDLPPTLPGAHSVENVLAASLAAFAWGVSAESIAAAVRSFGGVAHRMEFVRDLDGVRYINNSMCTNVAAALSSLLAMDRPTVVIMGGADKQLEYAPLAPALHEKAKHVLLIGQVADKMEAAFLAGGYKRISRATTLEDAVTQARSFADEGETVLLLPACASFDMFRDFEARGVAFRQAVHALASTTETAQSVSNFTPLPTLPISAMENNR